MTLTPFGGMYEQLADEFSSHGHCVTFVAPHSGSAGMDNSGSYPVLYFQSGKMYGVGKVERVISELLFPLKALNAIKNSINPKDFDLLLLTTPSIAFYKAVKYIKSKKNTIKFYLILRDIHPEGAKFVGLDKIKPIYKYFQHQAKVVYACSDKIGCMSPHSVSLIRNNYCKDNPDKVELLPNWGKKIDYKPCNMSIRSKYGLEGKYLLIYGGNMARVQNLPFIIQLAELKSGLKNVVFLFVGNGVEKQHLRNLIVEKNLNNVQIWDALPREDYYDLLKSADVGIITLHPRAYFANIPSKTNSYLMYKIPILASVDRVGDYNSYIIDNSHAGLWNYSDDIETLSRNFDILYEDGVLRKQMGENGYKYYMDNFTVDKTYKTIQNAL